MKDKKPLIVGQELNIAFPLGVALLKDGRVAHTFWQVEENDKSGKKVVIESIEEFNDQIICRFVGINDDYVDISK